MAEKCGIFLKTPVLRRKETSFRPRHCRALSLGQPYSRPSLFMRLKTNLESDMTKRHILTMATVGAAALMIPVTLGITSAHAAESAGPDAVTVLVQYSDLSGAYAEDASRFTMPVYFGHDETILTDEAQVALGALADETASYSTVSVTVRSNGDDNQAVAVYGTLYEYGVPVRVMALDLEDGLQGDGGPDVVASAI